MAQEPDVELVELAEDNSKYTYWYKDGRVGILRNGQPWLGEKEIIPGTKAWIEAAATITELRAENARLKKEIFGLTY